MAKAQKPTPDHNGKATQETQDPHQTGTTPLDILQSESAQTAPEILQSESTQTASEPPQSGSPDQQTVCVSYKAGLNLREGPHRDYKSLTVIPDGETLEVLDLPEGAKVPGWALVRCGEAGAGLVGWVNTYYVREG